MAKNMQPVLFIRTSWQLCKSNKGLTLLWLSGAALFMTWVWLCTSEAPNIRRATDTVSARRLPIVLPNKGSHELGPTPIEVLVVNTPNISPEYSKQALRAKTSVLYKEALEHSEYREQLAKWLRETIKLRYAPLLRALQMEDAKSFAFLKLITEAQLLRIDIQDISDGDPQLRRSMKMELDQQTNREISELLSKEDLAIYRAFEEMPLTFRAQFEQIEARLSTTGIPLSGPQEKAVFELLNLRTATDNPAPYEYQMKSVVISDWFLEKYRAILTSQQFVAIAKLKADQVAAK